MSTHRPSAVLARLSLAAWTFGNLYEGVVGVPELLADARPVRTPGLMSAGSPVRYFAPLGPIAIGATSWRLVLGWRVDRGRRWVLTAAATVSAALALSGHLIRTVNAPLLRDAELSEVARRQNIGTWHRVNVVRLLLLTATQLSLARIDQAEAASSDTAGLDRAAGGGPGPVLAR